MVGTDWVKYGPRSGSGISPWIPNSLDNLPEPARKLLQLHFSLGWEVISKQDGVLYESKVWELRCSYNNILQAVVYVLISLVGSYISFF